MSISILLSFTCRENRKFRVDTSNLQRNHIRCSTNWKKDEACRIFAALHEVHGIIESNTADSRNESYVKVIKEGDVAES